MTQPDDAETPDQGPTPRPASPPGLGRQTAEFVVVLSLCILLFRTFAAEAYIVPTGSMAPTLLGNHKVVECPDCRFRFPVGLDEEGRAGSGAVCPNCARADLDREPAVASNGDRVLVQKFLYDVRRPKRWEVAVFQFPGDPSQPYVKRVVGLPGERIQIDHGDIVIDGVIARKTLREQKAMRVLVYDNNFGRDPLSTHPARWNARRGPFGRTLPSGWRADGTRLVHETPAGPPSDRLDWIEYRHRNPDRDTYGPVRDFTGYNGGDVRAENVVTDLMVEARVSAAAGTSTVAVRIDAGSDRFLIEIPVAGAPGTPELPTVRRNNRLLDLANARGGLKAVDGRKPLPFLEASVFDQRLTVAVDGVPLFDPLDFRDPRVGPGPNDSPIAFGVKGGALALSDVRIYRDVYYTSALAFTPRRPFGVGRPYELGKDEFFVLGDNSAVSNDSRFWNGSPVVPGRLFLGKPFLVHLPGQVVPLQVFGRSPYWVPDPREIRYIR